MSSPAMKIAAAVRPEKAADQIEERALAGAVRTDDGAELARHDVRGQMLLEARRPPKRLVQIDDTQDRFASWLASLHQAHHAVGQQHDQQNDVMPRNKSPIFGHAREPSLHQHVDDAADDRADEVFMPPRIVITIGVALAVQFSQPGNTLWFASAKSDPASPAKNAAMTKVSQRCSATFIPSAMLLRVTALSPQREAEGRTYQLPQEDSATATTTSVT